MELFINHNIRLLIAHFAHLMWFEEYIPKTRCKIKFKYIKSYQQVYRLFTVTIFDANIWNHHLFKPYLRNERGTYLKVAWNPFRTSNDEKQPYYDKVKFEPTLPVEP